MVTRGSLRFVNRYLRFEDHLRLAKVQSSSDFHPKVKPQTIHWFSCKNIKPIFQKRAKVRLVLDTVVTVQHPAPCVMNLSWYEETILYEQECGRLRSDEPNSDSITEEVVDHPSTSAAPTSVVVSPPQRKTRPQFQDVNKVSPETVPKVERLARPPRRKKKQGKGARERRTQAYQATKSKIDFGEFANPDDCVDAHLARKYGLNASSAVVRAPPISVVQQLNTIDDSSSDEDIQNLIQEFLDYALPDRPTYGYHGRSSSTLNKTYP